MSEAGRLEAQVDALFAAIDAMDTEAFLGYLTEDARFRFGSAPAVEGQAAIRSAVDGFFESLAGLTHRLTKKLRDGDAMFVEGETTYRRHDGREVTVPFADVFELRNERIADYKIYADISPLYAD